MYITTMLHVRKNINFNTCHHIFNFKIFYSCELWLKCIKSVHKIKATFNALQNFNKSQLVYAKSKRQPLCNMQLSISNFPKNNLRQSSRSYLQVISCMYCSQIFLSHLNTRSLCRGTQESLHLIWCMCKLSDFVAITTGEYVFSETPTHNQWTLPPSSHGP